MKRGRLTGVIFWLTLAFLYLPIAVVVANSFNAARYGGQWQGFSLIWYQQLMDDHAMWDALWRTLIVGVSATAVAVVLGTLSALGLHRAKGLLFRAHYSLVYLPLAVPDILMGIALLLFFVMLRIELGLLTIILAHACFCISYVAMVVLARLQDFDFSTVEAARDLGAGPFQAAWRVLLPQLLPGIVSGAMLAFTLSVDDYVITFFVAGPGSTTLPLKIYSMIKYGSPPVINAISTLMLAVTFLLVGLSQRFQAKEKMS